MLFNSYNIKAQDLPGFTKSGAFEEQQMVIEDAKMGTRILINAPLQGFGEKDKVLLVFFALPNGNTIEQTMGKNLQKGDDWHFNIQHIAAQTRFLRHQFTIRRLNIPVRETDAEVGSAFMKRIDQLSLKEREEEIFKAISAGNIPGFLRNTHLLKAEFADSAGIFHKVVIEVMPDYLAVGNDQDFCRIPMNPFTAQRLADTFGGSLLTAKLSDYIYRVADLKLVPFNYVPVGNANELVSKFVDHNIQIERQFNESTGTRGDLVAGIQKDIILSNRIKAQPGKVVIYGWHKLDGKPIQPVYSGHVWWYVDYSHGIRLINNQAMIDGKPMLISDVLKDPLLYKLFSDENGPMQVTRY